MARSAEGCIRFLNDGVGKRGEIIRLCFSRRSLLR